MAYREFEGPLGEAWRVWDVYPSHAERRTGASRATEGHGVQAGDGEGRPDEVGERRRLGEPRVLMPPELMGGWLCFETEGDRRRLVPVPEGWSEAPIAQLRSWLREATPAPARRPRE